jgi:hypothetical protein
MGYFFIFAFVWINGWFLLLAWVFGLFDSTEERDRKYRERKNREFEIFKQDNIRRLNEKLDRERGYNG